MSRTVPDDLPDDGPEEAYPDTERPRLRHDQANYRGVTGKVVTEAGNAITVPVNIERVPTGLWAETGAWADLEAWL